MILKSLTTLFSTTKIPRWSRLRELGDLTVVKATILIPVLGYIVLFNNQIMEYLKLSSAITGDVATSPVSWRLLMIYFGLCSIAAASALYAVYCPPLIKTHPTGSAYVAAECDSLGELRLNIIERKLARKHPEEYARLRQAIDRRTTENLGEANKYEGYKRLLKDNAVDVMQYEFALDNHELRWVRLGIATLFALGFALLAIPSADVFMRCLKVLGRLIG